jgi:hypothetical protein
MQIHASWSMQAFAVAALVVLGSNATARTIDVRQDGSGDAVTLSEALLLAESGDSIDVGPGTYTESVVIDKRVVIYGAGADATTINGSGEVPVVQVVADGVELSRMTFRGGESPDDLAGGGLLAFGQGITVSMCAFTQNRAVNGAAVFISSSEDVAFIDNVVYENEALASPVGSIVDIDAPGEVVGNVIRGNTGTALSIRSLTGGEIQIRSNDIRDNRGGSIGGLYLGARIPSYAQLNIIAFNEGLIGGVHLDGDFGTFSLFEQNLCFGNEGRTGGTGELLVSGSGTAVRNIVVGSSGRQLVELNDDAIFGCNDVFSPTGARLYHGEDRTGMDGNFSADPLHCDEKTFDLRGDSPCLPANHPDGADCELVGPRDQGCDAVPTISTTWGRLKQRFAGEDLLRK